MKLRQMSPPWSLGPQGLQGGAMTSPLARNRLIFGGMGLMEEMPIERLWRDSRLERIWDGTSEIQRHIITRSMLRPLGA